jgi:uncharacterized membrane protein
MFGGLFLCTSFNKKKKQGFEWRTFALFILGPLCGVLLISRLYDQNIIYFFILSSILGTVLEYLVGYFYHHTFHERLWKYDRLNIGGYTSWLAVPMWGAVSIIFWVFAKALGI